MADKIESTMLVIRLVPPGIEPTVPLPVRDGVYTGRSMDKVYVQCGHARDRVNSITLLGAASACWVDGIEEFCFD